MCDDVTGGVLDVERGSVGLLKTEADEVPVKIESFRRTPKGVLLKLSGIDSRLGAEAVKGAEVLMPATVLPALNDGEFYGFELEGLRVYDEYDNLLGYVKGFIETAGNDVLVIDRGQREHLIPWVREHIVSVSPGDRIIIRDIPWE
jgi:16S rRNA processing protein RimM